MHHRFGLSRGAGNRLRTGAAATAIAVVFGLAAAPSARASSGSMPAADGSDVPPVSTAAAPSPSVPPAAMTDPEAGSAHNKAEAKAMAQAQSSGQPVVVDALTTTTTQTTAMPDGTFRLVSNPAPVRVEQDGSWVPVDTTLATAADGTVAPKATVSGLAFSGGGSGPLVTMSEGSKSMSLTWPDGDLPKPVLNGATATYQDVISGVDLVVTAAPDGFSDNLVVKTRQAASSTELKTISFGLSTKGLTVRASAHGGVEAVDTSGRILISAPAPHMWDAASQSSTASPAPTASATTASASTRSAMTATTTQDSAETPGSDEAELPLEVTSGQLTLTPDQSVLTGPDTIYPVTIDPSYSGVTQAWTMLDSQWPTTSFWKGSNWKYTGAPEPRVGHVDDPDLGAETLRSVFQINTSGLAGKHVLDAEFDTFNDYSYTCTAEPVDLWQTGTISSANTWNKQPSWITKLATTTESHGYNSSCGPATLGFRSSALTTIAQHAADGKWANLTLGLRAPDESNQSEFKHFHVDPSLQITYNSYPKTPSSGDLSLANPSVGCVTSTANAPWIGKSATVTPPTVQAKVSDPDGGTLTAHFTYGVVGGTTKTGTGSASSGQVAKLPMDSTFLAGVKDGDTLYWKASVSDGTDSSSTSPTCYVKADLSLPDVSITSADGIYPEGSSSGAAAGTPGNFRITSTGTGSPVSSFVWALDQYPPNPSQKVTATAGSGSTYSATITATPLFPGTHTLSAYAVDSAGNTSSTPYRYVFTADGTPNRTYGSLQQAYNNTAISDDTQTTEANADGNGASFSAQDVTAAGWTSGGSVILDGATFTLPAYGSGQPDNVLAGNQTIQMPPTRGSALVFLTTATDAFTTLDEPNADDPKNATSPYVSAGTNITGTDCTINTAESNKATDCQAASGTLTYTDGTTVPYYLNVPDWVSGPSSLAAITLPHRNTASGQVSMASKLYAYAVPLNSGKTLASVTLPDVGASIGLNTPGLHIFGMSTRDTADGTGDSSNTTWTRSWASPIETVCSANWSSITVRTALPTALSGGRVRIRLENTFASAPATFNHITLANQSGSGQAATATPVPVTFGSHNQVTVPAGGEVYSDPVSLSVTAGTNVLASFYMASAPTQVPCHTSADAQNAGSGNGSGDHTADTSGSAFTSTWQTADYITGLDVATDKTPTVAVLGDTTTNGIAYKNAVGSRWPDQFAADQLSGGTPAGVANAAIAGNRLASDQTTGGVSALSRLDRDILDIPNLSTVVIAEGFNDLAAGTTADSLDTSGYQPLLNRLKAFADGTNTPLLATDFASLTPCGGSTTCTTNVTLSDGTTDTVDGQRSYLNSSPLPDTAGNAGTDNFIDFDSQLADTSATPEALQATYDEGDHIDLTDAAAKVLADTVASDPNYLSPTTPLYSPIAAPPAFQIEGEYFTNNKLATSSPANAATTQASSCCSGVTWSQGAQLLFNATASGNTLTLPFTAPATGDYTLTEGFTQASDYGTHILAIDGHQIGTTVDAYATKVTPAQRVAGRAWLTAGNHTLTLTINGKNNSSSGYKAGIDYLRFDPTGTRQEAENLIPATNATLPLVVQTNCCNTSWSAGAQARFDSTTTGSTFTLTFGVQSDADYKLTAGMTQASDYGSVTFTIDGQTAGSTYDGYHSPVTTATADLGTLHLTAGTHQLTITINGKNSSSSGYKAGIDYLDIQQAPTS